MTSRTVRYCYRLRPGAAALAALEREWDLCRWVWNQCVATSRAAHQQTQATGVKVECGPAFLDKQLTTWRAANPWLASGSSVAQQQTIRDFGAARSKALTDRKNKIRGRRRGLPRFRKKDLARPTMNFTKRGFSLKPDPDSGRLRLHLPGGVTIPVVWSRDLPSDPKSVRVYSDSLGHWYASFVVTAPEQTLDPTPDAAPIGIDWGVKQTATTTEDAYDLDHAEHGRKSAQRLARYQRMMARRRPKPGKAASKGYRKAQRQAAKAHKKVARQRTDTARKWAKKVVRDHDRIAVEDFRPSFLARSTMARKAADARIATTKAELVWMATKHGRDLRLVNPAHTTMDCSDCGARTTHRLPLSERTYTCTSCGTVKPRDKNSAAVMVARAGFDPADVEGIRPGLPSGTQAA